MARYRVIEKTVEVCNGYVGWYERRFMAQRRTLLGWWWPVYNAKWRETEREAAEDIRHDIDLREPAVTVGIYDHG